MSGELWAGLGAAVGATLRAWRTGRLGTRDAAVGIPSAVALCWLGFAALPAAYAQDLRVISLEIYWWRALAVGGFLGWNGAEVGGALERRLRTWVRRWADPDPAP